MIETINKVSDAAKRFVMWVLTPIAAIAMTIAYLLYKNSNLKNRLLEANTESKTQQDKGVMNEKDTKAATSLDEYRKLRALYIGSGDKPKP